MRWDSLLVERACMNDLSAKPRRRLTAAWWLRWLELDESEVLHVHWKRSEVEDRPSRLRGEQKRS